MNQMARADRIIIGWWRRQRRPTLSQPSDVCCALVVMMQRSSSSSTHQSDGAVHHFSLYTHLSDEWLQYLRSLCAMRQTGAVFVLCANWHLKRLFYSKDYLKCATLPTTLFLCALTGGWFFFFVSYIRVTLSRAQFILFKNKTPFLNISAHMQLKNLWFIISLPLSLTRSLYIYK